MKNFTFCNPTKVIFGENTTSDLGKHLSKIASRVLLVYGSGSVERAGILDKVVSSLEEHNIEWVEFSGVKSNPVLSKVKEGIAEYRENDLEAVVAVGGGSVIDTAKTIAAGVMYDGDIWDYFIGKGYPKVAAPIAVVQTLAATASEMNSTAVITNEETRGKLSIGGPSLYPAFSILDPVNTFSVPVDYSMYGAVDAVSHLLEGYFNGSAGNVPIQDTMVEGLVRNIISCANVIREKPQDYHARSNLMWAAVLGFNGLTTVGVGVTGFPMHMIEHSLSALYDVPHGAGLSVIVPAWLKFQLYGNYKKITQLGYYAFGIRMDDDFEAAQATIEKLEQWFKSIGCPVLLQDLDIPYDDHELRIIADNAVITAKQWGLKEYTREVIEKILMIASGR